MTELPAVPGVRGMDAVPSARRTCNPNGPDHASHVVGSEVHVWQGVGLPAEILLLSVEPDLLEQLDSHGIGRLPFRHHRSECVTAARLVRLVFEDDPVGVYRVVHPAPAASFHDRRLEQAPEDRCQVLPDHGDGHVSDRMVAARDLFPVRPDLKLDIERNAS